MPISPKKIWFDENSLWVELSDARIIGVPLAWFPRLLAASPEALQHYELSVFGIHWEGLNEDISIQGLLAGQMDMTKQARQVA